MWREQVDALASRHRVIALDLRGYGESELPPAPFANHDDVAGLLDALGIERAALVGWSFGGAVAIDTALAHPDRVTALALLGAAVSGNRWSDEANDLWDSLIGEVDPANADRPTRLPPLKPGPGRPEPGRPKRVDHGVGG
ncbi:alpha/beta fold hydrolase [Micromonospora sp. HSS6-12]|uniref:Alpha/beta fold hydrolase n=2 Tax=Micromonospora thermarum TaxID=2720024 RepID=A0ABX0Z2X1_9ACTN|nr:alpha/beta fold hydrolase [Micromonospora thermarum]